MYNVICQLYLRKLGKTQMFLWFGFSFLPPLFICAIIFPGGSDDKNLPATRETWVRSLGWEDPLEEGMATHSNILAWRIPMDRGAWRASPWGRKELDMTERLSTHTHKKNTC